MSQLTPEQIEEAQKMFEPSFQEAQRKKEEADLKANMDRLIRMAKNAAKRARRKRRGK